MFTRHFQKMWSLRPKATLVPKPRVPPPPRRRSLEPPTWPASPSQPTRGHHMTPDDQCLGSGPTDLLPKWLFCGSSSAEQRAPGKLPSAREHAPLLLPVSFVHPPRARLLG